jgi:hypothetical protein
MGLWILTILHYTLYEGIDLIFLINVEFMLCPSQAMKDIFESFPPWLFFPSYRTTLALTAWVIGSLLMGLFISVASLIAKHIIGLDIKSQGDVTKIKGTKKN